MKKGFLLAIFALLFITWSCGDTKDKKAKDDDTEETGKKKKKTTDDEETSDENSSDDESNGSQSDPADVVRTIIKAAKTENYSSLSNLCADESDGDAKDICNMENLVDRQKEFQDFFGKAKVVGDAEISGNEAAIKIQTGGREETINLVKEGKKWKLSSF